MTLSIGSKGRYNFHNVDYLTIRVHPDNYIYDETGKVIKAVRLTASQIKRVSKHFCPWSDCRCGSGPDGWDDDCDGNVSIHL